MSSDDIQHKYTNAKVYLTYSNTLKNYLGLDK